jgi:gluconolactonase
MTLSATTVAALLMLGVAFRAAGQQSEVVAPGAQPQKLSSDYKFTEGPAADRDGNVYFTDQPNDRIVKWSAADNSLADFLKPAGRSNGLCLDTDGKILACADERNELWSVDPATKQHTVLVKDFNGKLLNGPNDLWVHPSGTIYFTDPLYKRDYWKGVRDPAAQQDVQAVYRLAPDRKTLTRVATDLKQPNGIVGTPDGRVLYVADIGAKKTYRYTVAPDGSLTDKQLHCEQGSDGMTLDDQGNLYLTGKGVTVFDKAGKKVRQIDIPEGWTANVCFGGKDRDTLFITASKSVYTLKMTVKGAGSQ